MIDFTLYTIMDGRTPFISPNATFLSDMQDLDPVNKGQAVITGHPIHMHPIHISITVISKAQKRKGSLIEMCSCFWVPRTNRNNQTSIFKLLQFKTTFGFGGFFVHESEGRI